MKKILIASFDMEVGGVERSLISMLDNFDYVKCKVDLMLYSHTGDFMPLLTDKVNLLPEVKELATFRKSVGQTLKEGNVLLGATRVISKVCAQIKENLIRLKSTEYIKCSLCGSMHYLFYRSKKMNMM